MNNDTINAQALFNALPATIQESIKDLVLAEAITKLTGKGTEVKTKKNSLKKVAETKTENKGNVKQVTTDGTNRSASQFIRDNDPELSQKELIALGAAVGLSLKPALITNVRKQALAKAAAAAGETPVKRGPGRPKGSKNKTKTPKADEPTVNTPEVVVVEETPAVQACSTSDMN